jgi:hypothetical protein
MTPSKAKKLVKSYLNDNQMTYGIEGSAKNADLKNHAVDNGFRVTFPELIGWA